MANDPTQDIDVQRLRLAPGDVLVATIRGVASAELVARVSGGLMAVLPTDVKLVVLDQTVTLAVLTRADLERMLAAKAEAEARA